jgi:hypothetical protein
MVVNIYIVFWGVTPCSLVNLGLNSHGCDYGNYAVLSGKVYISSLARICLYGVRVFVPWE